MATFKANNNPLYAVDKEGTPGYIRHLDIYTSDSGKNPNDNIVGVAYDIESQLLRGTMAFSKDKLSELDPSYQGYTHVFCVRVPPILSQVARGKQVAGFDDPYDETVKSSNSVEGGVKGLYGRQHCRNLKTLFEMGCTSISGTPSLTLNTSQVSVGWNDRSYPAPTTSEYDGTSFTLKVLECRGDPLRRGVEYYISGVSDPNVKAAMMNGALDDNDRLLAPTLANFTWAFMIVQTDQTMLTIQDVSLWNSCIITGIDRSNLDWENGTVDIVQPRDVTFNGMYMPDCRNKYLHKMAARLLGMRLQYYKRYQDMDSVTVGATQWDRMVPSWDKVGGTEGLDEATVEQDAFAPWAKNDTGVESNVNRYFVSGGTGEATWDIIQGKS